MRRGRRRSERRHPGRRGHLVRSYFICSTPRSGSWLLASMLEQSRVAGRPREYFWRETEADLRHRWGASSFREYLRRVLEEGSTPNGVFGAKMMWGYLGEAVRTLRALGATG